MATNKRTLLVLIISPMLIVVQIVLGVMLVQKIVQVDKSSDDKSKLDTYLRDNLIYLVDAETGQRGYLLTGETVFLDPYNLALVKLKENNKYLSTFATSEQIKELEPMQRRAKDKLDFMALTIRLNADGRKDSALTIVKTGQGKKIMDSIRQDSSAFLEGVSKNMNTDQSQEYRLVYIFLFSMALLLLFHLFFWYFIYYRFNKYTNHILELVEQLNDSNRYLEQFAYISAHDIKSPIITTQGLVNILINSNAVKEEYTNVTGMLKGTVDQMHRTNHALNNILKVRKNLLQKSQIPDTSVALTTIIQEVLSTLQSNIETLHATVEIQVDGIGKVLLPYVHIQSIFYNLISNALKYHDAERPLTVTIKASKNSNGFYVFSVSDNGIGIDLNRNQDKLYGIFRRFHDHVEGEGVGLHIVKSIVDAYNGTIDVTSETAIGTTFTITLPPIMESYGN